MSFKLEIKFAVDLVATIIIVLNSLKKILLNFWLFQQTIKILKVSSNPHSYHTAQPPKLSPLPLLTVFGCTDDWLPFCERKQVWGSHLDRHHHRLVVVVVAALRCGHGSVKSTREREPASHQHLVPPSFTGKDSLGGKLGGLRVTWTKSTRLLEYALKRVHVLIFYRR